MAIQGYAGSTTNKLALALGKGVSLSTVSSALAIGTAVLILVAGAAFISQAKNLRLSELEVSDEKSHKN